MVFEYLRLACIALFTVAIPALLLARRRRPGLSVWTLFGMAAGLGWALAYAHMFLMEPMRDAVDLAQMTANNECAGNPPWHQNADGSFDMDCSIGIGDWLPEYYHPLESLLYGPVYLFCSGLAATLLLRTMPRWRRGVLILGGAAVLVVAWILAYRYALQIPLPIQEWLVHHWNPFLGPQVSAALSLVFAWLILVSLPDTIRRACSRHRALARRTT